MILALFSVVSAPAHAFDVHWWGVGGTVGTLAIPGLYPSAFPQNARSADGDPLVQKVRGDVSFGVHALLYPDNRNRLGLRGLLGVGIGQPWSSAQVTLEYERALVTSDGFQLVAGAGLGAGTERFLGTADAADSRLVVNYFPVRAQIGPLLRDKSRAYEISIYATWHIVADQTWYEAEDAEGVTGADVAAVPGALYAGVGVEASVYFGDFRSKRK